MEKIMFRLALASMLLFWGSQFVVAQICDPTPISNQQWSSSPSLEVVNIDNEVKWYRFTIVRERQYFHFEDVAVPGLPVFYEVWQGNDPNACPTEQLGSGAFEDDMDEFHDGFVNGPNYGFIKFETLGTGNFKFSVMYGDPQGSGEDDFAASGLPEIPKCGNGPGVLGATLSMTADPEVVAYMGPEAPIGVWFQYTTPGNQYISLSVNYPQSNYPAQTRIFGNIVTGAPPETVDPTFEPGASCTWHGGYEPGTFYIYVYTDAGAAPGFAELCVNSTPVPTIANNDAFADALSVDLSPYGNCDFTHASTTNSSYSPYPENTCPNYPNNVFHYGTDIWYSFVAEQRDCYFSIENITFPTSGNLEQVAMSVWNSNGTEVIGENCHIFFQNGSETISAIRGLDIGNTYKIRLGGWVGIGLPDPCEITCEFDFCLAQPPCSPNDECSEAIPFTPPAPGGSITLSGSTYCAEFEAIGGCYVEGNRSAWYSFTAAESNYEFKLISYQDVFNIGYNGVYLQLTTDCNGSTVPVSCIDLVLGQTEPIGGLTVGQTYYLRVSTSLTDAAFDLEIKLPIGLNSCGSIAEIPVSGSCNYTNISTVGASQSLEGACGGNSNDDDVWYNFTPTTSAVLFSVANMQATQGSFNAVYFGVYESCGGAMLACFFLDASTSQVVSSLIPGQSYKLQIFTFGTGNFGTFDVCLQSVAAPANDLCANAQSVSPSLYSSSTPNILSVNTLGASGGVANCFGDPVDDDLWYSFTATGNSYFLKAQNIVVNSGQPGFPVVKIEFFESCGGASISCFNLFEGYGRTQLFTSGQTYFYRVWTDGTDYTASFDLLHLQLPNTPSNDYCDSPTPLSVVSVNDPCSPVAGSTLGGSYSLDYDCGFDWWDDVYFSFTADYPVIAATFDNFSQLWGNSTGLRVQLFGNCLSDYDFVCHEVTEGETVLFSNLNVGQTYFIKVFSANCVECYTSFDICLKEGGPANDIPNFSFEFNVNNGGTISGSTANASYDAVYGLPTCVAPGTPIQDVWYFLENYDHINGEVTISNASNDIKSAIYKGDINTPGNFQILFSTCGSGNRTITLNGLESGQYYWLRIWTENGSAGTFSVSYQDLTPTTAAVATTTPNQCASGASVLVNTTNINAGIPIMMGDDPILILYPNGNELGLVNVDFYIASTSRTDNQGIPYLRRNIAVTPQFQPATGNPVLLRFLLTQEELNNLTNVALADLKVTRVNNQPCAETVSGSDNTLLSQPYAWANGNYLEGYYFDVLTDHFSSFYAHGGNVALQGSLLPVELLDFQAEIADNNTALLSWRTATEHDNEGFYIEKSMDGIRFQTIAFVPGAGTSLAENSYAYLDKSFTTSAYYRLQQTDFDGDRTYTDVVFLKTEDRHAGFSISPNPAGNELRIHLSHASEGTYIVHIVDASGKKIREELWHLTNSTNHKTLSISSLPAGFYALVVHTPTGIMVENFVKR